VGQTSNANNFFDDKLELVHYFINEEQEERKWEKVYQPSLIILFTAFPVKDIICDRTFFVAKKVNKTAKHYVVNNRSHKHGEPDFSVVQGVAHEKHPGLVVVLVAPLVRGRRTEPWPQARARAEARQGQDHGGQSGRPRC